MEDHGQVRLPCKIHRNGPAVPRRHECQSARRRRVLPAIFRHQRSVPGLCLNTLPLTSSASLQHDVPNLFSMMFSAMLTDAFRDGDVGVCFQYRTDGSVFNLRRLQAKTKVQEDIARDFLFADDCALNAGTEPDIQGSVDQFSKACDDFGLTISIKKTEVLHQPAPATPYVEPNITVNGQKLAVTDKFVYLGSTLSRSVNIDEEVSYRIARASAAFGRLRDTVWERRGLTKETKLKVYQAVVLPSLLYACETWTTNSRHIKQSNAFHMRCLRSLLHIKWQDKVPDTEVL